MIKICMFICTLSKTKKTLLYFNNNWDAIKCDDVMIAVCWKHRKLKFSPWPLLSSVRCVLLFETV